METRVNVGIIGCGSISAPYVEGCKEFNILNILSCSDIIPEKASELAKKYDIPHTYSIESLLNDKDIQIVLNLTPPLIHSQINKASIQANKHVYCEKPLGVLRSEGSEIVLAAKQAGVSLGCAPDTFLGSAFQTCRNLLDEGLIGEPVAATAIMNCHGWEHWHPRPHFHFQEGGGPMLDMGPYYVTALISLLGPVNRVTGSSKITFPERKITSDEHYGEIITVETPTHIAGIMEFENGAICTIVTSFDVWTPTISFLEIYGTEGSLSLPDPNMYGGMLRVLRGKSKTWEDIQHTHHYHPEEYCRGIGVADFASSIINERPARANGDLAYHVLDVLLAFNEASETGNHIQIESRCDRPAPLISGENKDGFEK
jgi:predicted dehydrogenase